METAAGVFRLKAGLRTGFCFASSEVRVIMDELEKGLSFGLTGPQRAKALAAFEEQIRAWQMTMPKVEPLVMDFGLGDFRKVGMIEYWIANEAAAGYCGKFLFLFDGQSCPMHFHKKKLETFFVVKGGVRMRYDGSVREMREGDTLLVECNKPHEFSGIGPTLILEVSKPCSVDDNYFADPRVPYGGNYRGAKK